MAPAPLQEDLRITKPLDWTGRGPDHDQPIKWTNWVLTLSERWWVEARGWWMVTAMVLVLFVAGEGVVTTQLHSDWCLQQGCVIKLETFIIIRLFWQSTPPSPNAALIPTFIQPLPGRTYNIIKIILNYVIVITFYTSFLSSLFLLSPVFTRSTRKVFYALFLCSGGGGGDMSDSVLSSLGVVTTHVNYEDKVQSADEGAASSPTHLTMFNKKRIGSYWIFFFQSQNFSIMLFLSILT